MPPTLRARHAAPLLLVLTLLAATVIGGCGAVRLGGSSGGRFTIESQATGRALEPRLTTAAYHRLDANTADIYLSDLPQSRLTDPRDSLADARGNLIHIHLFLVPQAGSTPIDETACNITFHHALLAGPVPGEPAKGDPGAAAAAGIYAGGGFLFPRDRVGEGVFRGSIADATHRLIRLSPGFEDLLGPAVMSGRFSAPRDEHLARAMAAKLQQIRARVPAVPDEAAP